MDLKSWNQILKPDSNRSDQLFLIPSSYKTQFFKDLLTGSITSFSLKGFLQTDSDYVTSLSFIPLKVEEFINWNGTSFNHIGIGTKDLPAYQCVDFNTQKTYVKLFSYTPVRSFGNFLDFEPYTRMDLYVPYFAPFHLDLNKVYGHNIDCYLALDLWTGYLKCFVYLDESILLGSQEIKISIDIPIGQTNAQEINRNNITNGIGILGSAIATLVGAYSGNVLTLGMGISALTGTITKTLQTNEIRASVSGANGSRTDLGIDKTIRIIKSTTKQARYPDVALKGKPIERNYLLSTMTGYTEIGYINFNPNGEEIMDDEITEIENLLRTGVIL